MGGKAGSYFFRFSEKGGSMIGVFRKMEDGEFRLVECFDRSYFNLIDQPSGPQTYYFKAKIGEEWSDPSIEVTVRIP